MTRFLSALAAVIFGAVGLWVPVLSTFETKMVLPRGALAVPPGMLGSGAPMEDSQVPPEMLQFRAVPSAPETVAASLWQLSPPVFGLLVLALGFLVYSVCFNDDLLKWAASGVALFCVAGLGLALFLAFTTGHSVAWGIVPLVAALGGALVTWSGNQPLPALEDLSWRARPARSQIYFDRRAARGQAARGQAARGQAAAHDSRAIQFVLLGLAVTSLLGASCLPVIVRQSYRFAPVLFDGSILLAYSPFFVALMAVPIALFLVALFARNAGLRLWASGAGAALSWMQFGLIWRDAIDPWRYNYGLFATTETGQDSIGAGFWVLLFSSACWALLWGENSGWVSQLPARMRAAQAARAAKARSAARREPRDAGAIALHLFYCALVFNFCLSCFPLGIFLWRYFDEGDNRLAPAAFWGWVAGLTFLLGRFLWLGVNALA